MPAGPAAAIQPPRRRLAVALLGTWALAIWVGSLLPLAGPPLAQGDKLQHLFGYGMLAWLGLRAFPGRPLAVWLGALLMGAAVEVAQSFTAWRSFDLYDIAANGLGALVGIVIWQAGTYRTRHQANIQD
ncbi:VanZ family protein [Chitiniphilus purpureus]|uniref:VanZ family protein n=1 Tax=Chitiniphilus purpureus TaxID=2981137 RepID=A0ABY6DSI9_9NEIS|nr:VanZ family protein [Chitiniphilus sp. CD1]UXY17326.1 VanZ family protein [Chitiniphilus sp. CD1]